MYYSAWDCQCNQYFHTGRNSTSYQKCFEDIRAWLIDGSAADSEDEEKMWKLPPDELLEMFEVNIQQHSKKLMEEI